MKTETTAIEWADYTFNPWRGCTKVSAGCANCYAETLSKRNPALLGEWGKGKPRVLAKLSMWQSPAKWNADAAKTRVLNGVPMIYTGSTETAGKPESRSIKIYEAGVRPSRRLTNRYHSIPAAEWDALPVYRPRVFCASLADWLDDEVPIAWLAQLLQTIAATPHLDWLLLTKRPQDWQERVTAANRHGINHQIAYDWIVERKAPANVWLGTSVENQSAADDRIASLLKIPAKLRFLSCEPLLGNVLLDNGESSWLSCTPGNRERSNGDSCCYSSATGHGHFHGIDWVICGGESGPNARPMHPDWARSLRNQCQAAGVPFLFKQWGNWQPVGHFYDDQAQDHYGPGCIVLEPSGAQVTDHGDRFDHQPHDRAWIMEKVGKKTAGRTLDGEQHTDFPTL